MMDMTSVSRQYMVGLFGEGGVPSIVTRDWVNSGQCAEHEGVHNSVV